MRCRLAGLVHELLAFATDGDQERVERHRGINGDFAAELILNFALFDSFRAILLENLVQVFDTHGGGCVVGIERLLSGWWANECVVVEKLLVVAKQDAISKRVQQLEGALEPGEVGLTSMRAGANELHHVNN
jgi:hypothetical protein